MQKGFGCKRNSTKKLLIRWTLNNRPVKLSPGSLRAIGFVIQTCDARSRPAYACTCYRPVEPGGAHDQLHYWERNLWAAFATLGHFGQGKPIRVDLCCDRDRTGDGALRRRFSSIRPARRCLPPCPSCFRARPRHSPPLALLPGGEAKDPRRDYAFSLLVALITCAVIYTMTQLVVISILPQSATTDRPMAAVAQLVLGAGGAALVSIGVLISCYGYLSANILGLPRFRFAMAGQRAMH